MSDYNFQGGDAIGLTPFYMHIEKFLKNRFEDDFTFMDLGSGVMFGMEEAMCKSFPSAKLFAMDRSDAAAFQRVLNNGGGVFSKVNFIRSDVEIPVNLDMKFDVVYFSELIEHIDKTDVLLKNCYNMMKDDGFLICTVPNLASFYSRMELLFGFQPHLLEVSNENAWFGTGFMGTFNNPGHPIHHIRGITYRAMKEMLAFHGFDVIFTKGHNGMPFKFIKIFTSLSSDVLYVCKKCDKDDGDIA